MGRYRAASLFVFLGLVWGSSFPAVEVGLEYFPALLFAAIRFDVAAVAMVAYAAATTDRWRPRGRDEWLPALIGGVFIIAAFHALTYVGQLYVTGAVAAVVVSLGPVMAAAFAAVLLPDEPFTLSRAVGLVFGVAGVAVIARPDPSNLLSASVVGVALVFVATVAFNLGTVLTRPFRTDLPVQTMQAWGMVIGAPLLHLAAAVRGESVAAIQWTVPGVLSLVHLALVCGSLAYLIYFHLLDVLGPVEITLIGYLEPVFAAAIGWLVLGQAVDVPTAVGFLAIVVGFAIIKRTALRRTIASLSGGDTAS
ncbi:DMT family transporter [Haloarculaceae archaeon H-GB2-1]|nr:DMT family transporter [Haloarculaceae archaeon H-GB1-1]MEA5386349.1 DMT family transporter [Haloarculaceae archaeon H-GB11]MEA5407852.1 DMT family transporter [Haloarculaceae archaeon H-GB2-1]